MRTSARRLLDAGDTPPPPHSTTEREGTPFASMTALPGKTALEVPRLRAAWSGQLRLARLPFYRLTFGLFPVAELTVGTLLILGAWTRPAAAVVLLMMLGAMLCAHRGGRPQRVPSAAQSPDHSGRCDRPDCVCLGWRHGGVERWVTETTDRERTDRRGCSPPDARTCGI